MKYEFWQRDPVPIWGVEAHQGEAFAGFAEPFMDLIRANKGGVTMRGVEIGRLPTILSTGIDVDPTDGVIYCEVGDKAYEYGGFPKVIMVLRYKNDAGTQVTLPACRIVYPDSSPESVAEARELNPFELESDGEGRQRRCPPSATGKPCGPELSVELWLLHPWQRVGCVDCRLRVRNSGTPGWGSSGCRRAPCAEGECTAPVSHRSRRRYLPYVTGRKRLSR